jgi:hypothetical protein
LDTEERLEALGRNFYFGKVAQMPGNYSEKPLKIMVKG